MAYQRSYGYQYETSPRKIQPEYDPNRKKKQYKKSSVSKKTKHTTNVSTKVKKQTKTDKKIQLIMCLSIAFVALLAVSYRNSLIAEKFSKKEELKEQLSSIQKENEQTKINIESSLNLNNIEQLAKEKLGMKKLDNNQKIYVNLPKKDYIEAATEEVVLDEELNFWQKIWKGLTESFK